jgi:hypothetical protein
MGARNLLAGDGFSGSQQARSSWKPVLRCCWLVLAGSALGADLMEASGILNVFTGGQPGPAGNPDPGYPIDGRRDRCTLVLTLRGGPRMARLVQ